MGPGSRAERAFTRVHSPSKTGVNALKDALWRSAGMKACGSHFFAGKIMQVVVPCASRLPAASRTSPSAVPVVRPR
jgi:hypothetical protein